jgi:predicted xylose isomerase-like sugar epimerase
MGPPAAVRAVRGVTRQQQRAAAARHGITLAAITVVYTCAAAAAAHAQSAAASAAGGAAAGGRAPLNVLVILSDDQGWGDVEYNCFNDTGQAFAFYFLRSNV